MSATGDSENQTPFRERGPISEAAALDRLTNGDVDVIGRMPWSSNATFLVDILGGDEIVQGIYKPEAGERPLWDFPGNLYQREICAYLLSQLLGWDLVPPTVERDSDLGNGSLQLFVPHDFEAHYFTYNQDPAHQDRLQRLCVFDILANSTDRKGGHCILDHCGRIWAIDNGLTFHTEFKLRTVIWDWSGQEIPAAILADVGTFLDGELPGQIADRLTTFERDALQTRARAVLHDGHFPIDSTGRRIPWPMV